MMEKQNSSVVTLIKQVIAWMVVGAFDAVEQRAHGVRLSATDLSQAVKGYGRNLVMPPDDAFADMDVVQVSSATLPTWSININLWTKEEGRSDLTLECTVIEKSSGDLILEIDDLHVL